MKFSAGKNRGRDIEADLVDQNAIVHYEGVGILESTQPIGTYLNKAHTSPGWRHATVSVNH